MRLMPLLPLALAGAIAAPAFAQQIDLQLLREITDAKLVGVDGTEIGEIGDVLVDETGRPVAVAIEIDEGFLDLAEEERVFLFDHLIWQNGNYTTSLTVQEIEALPPYDD